MDFFSVYKELRNRIRKYRPRSIVRMSMGYLWHPGKSKLEDLQKYPWQVLLLVKWTLQDTFASDKTGRDIKDSEFDDLRQRLFDFPERVSLSAAGSSATLFMRQLLQPQIAFQRDLSPSFAREAALLVKLAQDHPLRQLFLNKTGLEPLDFIDLAIASYAAVLNGRRRAPAEVLNASKDYLLVVTNRELNASRGTKLCEMYPEGKLDYPNVEASIYLPLERVYFISIDDFERLMAAARTAEFEVPSFLEKCVELDGDPATAKYFFEQHLNAMRVPMRRSPLLSEAIDRSYERIQQVLGSPISAR